MGEGVWSASLLEATLVRPGEDAVVVGRTSGGHATVLDAATGQRRSHLAAGLHSHLRSVRGLDDGSVVLDDGTRLLGFKADGTKPWTFEPGHGCGVLVTSGGPTLLAATDDGQVYRLDSEGGALWCARTPWIRFRRRPSMRRASASLQSGSMTRATPRSVHSAWKTEVFSGPPISMGSPCGGPASRRPVGRRRYLPDRPHPGVPARRV